MMLSKYVHQLVLGLSISISGVIAHADISSPTVSVPPRGSHGFPFSSSALNLRAHGYVEEEFFIAGSAPAYVGAAAFGTDGKWNATINPGVIAPYKTRLLVRRPNNSHFNGTVIVEWLNVSSGVDGTPDWSLVHPELLREGYAYVGVSAQYIGVAFNKQWDAARYNSLSHPGDSFSYAIYAQAAKAIRSPAASGAKPLGNLTGKIRAVIAMGESQSASRLWTYYNAIHPRDKIYDGFFIHSMGSAAALSQSYAGTGLGGSGVVIIPAPNGVPATPDISVPSGAGAVIRNDLKEPVFFLNTETDVSGIFGFPALHSQPDSRVFRLWEVAGTAHADAYLLAVGAKDAEKSGVPGSFECGIPPINSGPHRFVARAAVHGLNRWVRSGVLPRTAPRLRIENFALVRDSATGLALSGIRLPQVAVPVETLTGTRPSGSLASSPFCALFGANDPWNDNRDAWDGVMGFDPSPTPEPNLRTLYKNRYEYLILHTRALVKSVVDGFVRPRDMKEIYEEATSANIPH